MPTASDSTAKNVVLVHGGFVDGSGWAGVYQLPPEAGILGQRGPESDHQPGG